tara:strand:- start:74 stop:202 length:129 start_codon:yes stop_codon:yes gene_type:complete
MKTRYILAVIALAYIVASANDPVEKKPDPQPAHYPTKGKGKP